MKKNKMMRIASGLLVLNLMSTCAISGTFAKYVTAASVGDSARVAKWGVGVTATGSLFETTYARDGEAISTLGGDAINNTVVEVSSSTDVVAPGTKNDTGLTFSITGSPEVAVNIDFNITNVKDVYLSNGTYRDYTNGNDSAATFTTDTAYYPIVYTLKKGESVVKTGKMSDIEAYFNSLEGNYAPNTNLSTTFGTYTLTWAWAFGDDANNKADTYLGQMAATGGELPSGVSLEAGVDIAITVAQLD